MTTLREKLGREARRAFFRGQSMSLNTVVTVTNILILIALTCILFRLYDRTQRFSELIRHLRTLEQDYFDLLRKLHQALAEVEFLKKGK
jgi:heme/copper-type cytochrome/quinol oxidase subunit 2